MNEGANLFTIDWQALAAIATFFAVIVALVPVWRESQRVKSHARSLRFRLCSKLTQIRPSLGAVVSKGSASDPNAVLSKEEFFEVVQAISTMMRETEVLESDEQDQLGFVFANLEMAAVIYDTESFESDIAKNILVLIDRAVTVMSENGLLRGTVLRPWEK